LWHSCSACILTSRNRNNCILYTWKRLFTLWAKGLSVWFDKFYILVLNHVVQLSMFIKLTTRKTILLIIYCKRIWDKKAYPRTLPGALLVVLFLETRYQSQFLPLCLPHFSNTKSSSSKKVKSTSSPTLSDNFDDLANPVPFKNRWTGLMIGTKPNMGNRLS